VKPIAGYARPKVLDTVKGALSTEIIEEESEK